ncbi:MAG: glucose 1-dehydrogenase [Candidatus Hodarchaeota archaeon]
MKGLEGKNVLVTGASSGIGKAIAIRFAEEGANVVINYVRDENGANDTRSKVEKHGVKGVVIQADVSSEEEIVSMFARALDELGGLDVLINNAAILIEGPSHEIDIDTFDKVIAVDLRGPYICSREAIKHFIAEGKPGVIINISSAHDVIPKPGYVGYATSKGGIRNLTRTLALEYAGKQIRVNAVAPGATVTRINKAWTDDPEKRAKVESNIPLGYAAEPEQIASTVCFLASDDADYVTGAMLYVDGGISLHPEYRKNWSS